MLQHWQQWPVKFDIGRNPCWFGLAMTIYAENPVENCHLYFCGTEMKKVEAGLIVPPTCNFSQQDAQSLMDQLWNCGIRPTEGMGSAGSFTAQQSHLDDMRKVAFAALEKVGVKCPSR